MKRVTYIDSAKGLGILFVVMAHLLGVLVLNDPKAFLIPVWKYLCSCTIAFFFLSSGLTMAVTKEYEKPFATVLKKKLSSILYPYLTFSISYFIYKILAVFIVHNPDYVKEDIIKQLIDTISLKGSSVLWFLSALFLASLFTNVIIKRIGITSSLLLSFVLSLFVIFCSQYIVIDSNNIFFYFLNDLIIVLGRIFTTSFFLLLGVSVYSLNISKYFEIIISVVFIIINIILGQRTTIDFNNNIFENPIFAMVSMITGSIGLILLCKNLLDIKALQYLGKKSLIIMLTHIDYKVLTISLFISYKLIDYVNHAKLYVLYFLIIFIIILLEILWIKIFSGPLNILINPNHKNKNINNS